MVITWSGLGFLTAALPFSEAAAGEEMRVKRKSTVIVFKIMCFIEAS
jgi:hypothetical protein